MKKNYIIELEDAYGCEECQLGDIGYPCKMSNGNTTCPLTELKTMELKWEEYDLSRPCLYNSSEYFTHYYKSIVPFGEYYIWINITENKYSILTATYESIPSNENEYETILLDGTLEDAKKVCNDDYLNILNKMIRG